MWKKNGESKEKTDDNLPTAGVIKQASEHELKDQIWFTCSYKAIMLMAITRISRDPH